MSYLNWELDQTPANLIQQFEERSKKGVCFISTFVWSKKFKEFLSEKVSVIPDSKKESIWILKKGKKTWRIPMLGDDGLVVDPRLHIPRKSEINFDEIFLKNGKIPKKFHQKIKELDIKKRAFSGTEKQEKILQEIEELEKILEISFDEILEIM